VARSTSVFSHYLKIYILGKFDSFGNPAAGRREMTFKGGYTALVTPMREDCSIAGLEKLIEFQIANGIQGVLAVGTTGESPTLIWEEHNDVIERTCKQAEERCAAIAGTGSNSTRETLDSSAHAAHVGADAVLLVDPYYNGPSSLEIRREYVEPVAREYPEIQIIPYIIPGRTGTMMQVEDLAILAAEYDNVATVKEATGDLENMAKTRKLCGSDFAILSGDDDKTVAMMKSEDIAAAGVISVMSNIIPGSIQKLTELLNAGEYAAADELAAKLQPLLGIVGVATQEESRFGSVECKARNPLPIKTLMNILGMPSGPCRPPLGKMTRAGIQVVLEAARQAHVNDPATLAPIGEFFGVDVEARLQDEGLIEKLIYATY
jgi:4-hydroxy-tetrahydrodipicolinate synthase